MPKLSELINSMESKKGAANQVSEAWNKEYGESAWDLEGDHDDGWYHPSAIGGCPALLFLTLEKFPLPKDKPYSRPGEKPDYGKANRIFANGDGVHERIQRDLCNIGLLDVSMLDDTEETPIEIKKLHIHGHCDGVLNFGKRSPWKYADDDEEFTLFGKPVNRWKHHDTKDRAILEIKSINERGFKEVLSKGAKEDHKKQATIYCKALDIPRAIFIYENKDNQAWYEESVNYDEQYWKEIVAKITMIEAWRLEYRTTGKIPKGVIEEAKISGKERKPWGIYAIDFLRKNIGSATGSTTMESRAKLQRDNINKLLRRTR